MNDLARVTQPDREPGEHYVQHCVHLTILFPGITFDKRTQLSRACRTRGTHSREKEQHKQMEPQGGFSQREAEDPNQDVTSQH